MSTATADPIRFRALPGDSCPWAQVGRVRLILGDNSLTAQAMMPWANEGGSGASLSVTWENGEWREWKGLNSFPAEVEEWLPALRSLVERTLAETPEGQDLAQAHSRRSEGEPCFLRFGKLPKSGYSYDHRDNRSEPGVSVYPARKTPSGYWVDLAGIDAGSALFIIGTAAAFEVIGELVGHGADGEPCLTNCTARRIRKPVLGVC